VGRGLVSRISMVRFRFHIISHHYSEVGGLQISRTPVARIGFHSITTKWAGPNEVLYFDLCHTGFVKKGFNSRHLKIASNLKLLDDENYTSTRVFGA